MANEEHLKILREGVDRWNGWRRISPDIKPDLSEANLSEVNLSGANLSGANLRKANLSGDGLINSSLDINPYKYPSHADLIRYFCDGNLSDADLSNADLSNADLSNANLRKANFSNADLSHANLSNVSLINIDDYFDYLDFESDYSLVEYLIPKLNNANLSHANLSHANLFNADLSNANFSHANLSNANLFKASLSYANLSHVNLSNANLFNVNFFNASLFNANLSHANLVNANLRSANLIEANLSRTQARGAKLQQATLTGACIEDWQINGETQLDDVICRYVFLKSGQQERWPSDRSQYFAPGEFAQFVQQLRETVNLFFSNGIDWRAFALALEDLQVQYAKQDLSIQAIESRNNALVIRLGVLPYAGKKAIEHQAMELYERQRALQETQFRQELPGKLKGVKFSRLKFAKEAIEREYLNEAKLAAKPNKIVEVMAENRSAKLTQNFHDAVGKADQNVEGNRNVYSPEQKQTLAEAAADIQQLLEQLSQTYPTTTQAEKLAVAAKAAEEIEANPALRSRVIGALKAGGVEALKELVDHPLVTILIAALEGWQQPESK